MGNADRLPDHVILVRADRISTADTAAPVEEETVCVVDEAPVTIAVEGGGSYTVLCTPADQRELAVGFLFTEGVIETVDEIVSIDVSPEADGVVRVKLTGPVPRIWEAGRHRMVVSSCGACGSENLREAIDALPRVGDVLRLQGDRLPAVFGALSRRQALFKACGGTHAAAVFDADGAILASAEDSGRHNALDKTLGKCLLAGVPLPGCGVALTSRLSLEMVSKCARAGIELIAAVSAPTSMALEVARRCNITLCAFVRETRATVFTHPRRVTGAGR